MLVTQKEELVVYDEMVMTTANYLRTCSAVERTWVQEVQRTAGEAPCGDMVTGGSAEAAEEETKEES